MSTVCNNVISRFEHIERINNQILVAFFLKQSITRF